MFSVKGVLKCLSRLAQSHEAKSKRDESVSIQNKVKYHIVNTLN
jgi:hypothetical protein